MRKLGIGRCGSLSGVSADLELSQSGRFEMDQKKESGVSDIEFPTAFLRTGRINSLAHFRVGQTGPLFRRR
jgi:hypothetical protein